MSIVSSFVFLSLIVAAFAATTPSFALYGLTQGVPNMLTIFSGDADGTITYVTEVATGGDGSTGVQAQGAVFVLDEFIFAVNPGSNTVSLFQIDSTDPTNVTLIDSASSGGDFPNSVTAYGSDACVVNDGANNGLRCFTFSSSGLTVTAGSDRSFGLNLTTPPASHTGPAQISFTPNGDALVITNKGMYPPVMLYTFSNGMPGNTAVTSTDNGMVNFGFAFGSTGSFVLTDAAPYGNGSGIIVVNQQATGTPSVTFATPGYYVIPNQQAACWIAYSSKLDRFYVANSASNAISEVTVSGGTFTIVNTYPLGNNTAPTDMVVLTVNGDDYLFINEVKAEMLVSMKLAAGSTTTISTISSNTGSTHAAGLGGYVVPMSTKSSSNASNFAVSSLLFMSLLIFTIVF